MGVLSQYEPNFNAYARDVVISKPTSISRNNSSPGLGAFTYLQRHFFSARDIKAGEEIFVDVGEEYVNRNLQYMPKRDKAELIIKEVVELAETSPTFFKHYDEYMDTIKQVVGLYDEKSSNTLPFHDFKALSNYQIKTNVTQWIIENGKCFDNIAVKESKIEQAGSGAFAKRQLKRGSLVTPIPLFHIRNKDILNRQKGKEQLLLNYCFGHDESALLLCPTTHGGYINHSKKPNAKISWSESKEIHTLLKENLDDVDKLKWAVLSFDVIATKDIEENEEITINYGDSWQNAWNEHVSNNPFGSLEPKSYIYPNELSVHETDDVRTVYDANYADNIETICAFTYEDETIEGYFEQLEDDYPNEYLYRQNDIIPGDKLQDVISHFSLDGSHFNKPRSESYFWPCHVYYKQNADQYMVRILQSPNEDMTYFTEENVPLMFYNYPRQSIYFTDGMYESDQFLDGVFRFPIGIPDDIFPKQWMDVKKEYGKDEL